MPNLKDKLYFEPFKADDSSLQSRMALSSSPFSPSGGSKSVWQDFTRSKNILKKNPLTVPGRKDELAGIKRIGQTLKDILLNERIIIPLKGGKVLSMGKGIPRVPDSHGVGITFPIK